MKDGIREKQKIGQALASSLQTPVQISLVNNLEVKDALLIVKDIKAKTKYQTIIQELNIGNQFQVAAFDEVYGSQLGTRLKQEKL